MFYILDLGDNSIWKKDSKVLKMKENRGLLGGGGAGGRWRIQVLTMSFTNH